MSYSKRKTGKITRVGRLKEAAIIALIVVLLMTVLQLAL
jgi:hypothetical protein